MTRFFTLFILSLTSLSGYAQSNDWYEHFTARGVATTIPLAYATGRRVIENGVVSYENRCRSTNGRWSIQIYNGQCQWLFPAPGFPREVLCHLSADASCIHLNELDVVQVIKDTTLYEQTKIVGEVKKGQIFRLKKIEGDWAIIETLDGVTQPGWINLNSLKKSVERS